MGERCTSLSLSQPVINHNNTNNICQKRFPKECFHLNSKEEGQAGSGCFELADHGRLQSGFGRLRAGRRQVVVGTFSTERYRRSSLEPVPPALDSACKVQRI